MTAESRIIKGLEVRLVKWDTSFSIMTYKGNQRLHRFDYTDLLDALNAFQSVCQQAAESTAKSVSLNSI